ncbi:MAG: hypothetical protein R3B72_27125 [Polyangiaceae bacterium]
MSRRPAPKHRVLLALAFASGMCGLAYEVLYSRLLTTYLGDMVTVSATILAAFLTGIGVGSLLAHRFQPWLWLIEGLIGVYGLLVAAAFSQLSPTTLASLAPRAGGVASLVATVALVVALPSALIGCSVPLFASYLADAEREASASDSFARVYALYNLGAAACVLVIEFWLLRSAGLSGGLVAIALVNFGTAAGLRLWVRPPPAVAVTRLRRPSTALVALFLVSAVSASYQLLMLRFVGTVFGPFHENFALVLAVVMVGLAAGAAWARRRRLPLSIWASLGGLVILLSAVGLGDTARLWALASGTLVQEGSGRTVAKAIVLLVMTLPAFTVFGGAVPAYLQGAPARPGEAGRALAVSSFGNCFGFLLTVFVLLAHLSYRDLVLFVGLLTVGAGLAIAPEPWRRSVAVTLGALALAGIVGVRWPERQFALGHLSFVSSKKLAEAEAAFVRSESIKRLDGDVTIIHQRSGAEYVTINGYSSFAVAEDGATNHREVIVGVAPALYPPERRRALVLGTGTGITAGATATLFDHTEVVEINPAVFAALPRFASHNFDLARRPGVDLLLEDGLSVLARDDERYDLVISTVTSPVYFSSSKLYTVDFFELVKRRLAPGGVFAFWFDARISEAGTGIILETMRSAFSECHFVFLFDSYYEAICGDSLAPRPLGDYPAELTEAMALWAGDVGLDALLDAVLLAPGRFADRRWAEAPNTFDLPILEHIMARETLAHERPWDLDGWVKFETARSLVSGEAFEGPRFALRCHLLARVGSRTMLPECHRRLTDHQGGQWDRHFVDLAYDYLLADKRSVLAFEDLVKALILTDQKPRALEVLRLRKKRRSTVLEVARLQLQMELEGSVDDRDVAELYARSPLAAEVRRFLVRLSLKRDRPDQALAHLDFLARVFPLTEPEKALHARLRARTQEAAP